MVFPSLGVDCYALLQGIFPTQASLLSAALAVEFFTTSATWKAHFFLWFVPFGVGWFLETSTSPSVEG